MTDCPVAVAGSKKRLKTGPESVGALWTMDPTMDVFLRINSFLIVARKSCQWLAIKSNRIGAGVTSGVAE
jgi:hypothetical protein